MSAHTRGFFGRNWQKVSRRYRFVNQTETFAIPHAAGKALRRIYLAERGGTALDQGIRIGTAAGDKDVLHSGTVDAAGLVEFTPDNTALAKVPQTLHVQANADWGGAVIDLTIEYDEVPYA